jgi:periplasmic divalent cation tolerance protein
VKQKDGRRNRMNEDYCEVIITAGNAAWLADFTRSLVDARLAACGQNIAGIWSIYRWQGNIEDEGEARVALHTRASLVPAIVERTKTDHPYEVPCVIALPILGGNPDYLAWIEQETRAAEEPQHD